MEKSTSGFYIIDAYSLRQTSKKPFHLEKRFLKPSLIDAELRRETAELNRNNHIEQRRAASKELVERAKVIARQNMLRFEQEQKQQRAKLDRRLEQCHARRQHMLSQRGTARSKRQITQQQKRAQAPSEKQQHQQQQQKKQHQQQQHNYPEQQQQRKQLKQKQRYNHEGHEQEEQSTTLASSKVKPGNSNNGDNSNDVSKWCRKVAVFRSLGLPSVTAPETWLQFGHLADLLRSKKVIFTTARLLNVGLHVKDKNAIQSARVLLSAYMMVICPYEVFQDAQGMIEQQLLSAAKQLLQRFERWIKTPEELGTPQSDLRVTFEECWNTYLDLFESWKSADQDELLSNMSAYCLELCRLKHALGRQGEAEGLAGQLNEQIQYIKRRIEGIGGPEAVEKYSLAEQALEASLHHQGSSASSAKPPPPSPTPRARRIHDDAMAATTQPQQTTHSPPPSQDFIAEMLSQHVTGDWTNEKLAHEIVLNPDFELQKPQDQSELERRVREMATKAFFDKLEEDIQQDQAHLSLPQLLVEIRDRLLTMVRPTHPLARQISDAIDIDLIRQQLNQKSFDLDGMISTVLGFMSQLCAPVRDADVSAIAQITNRGQQVRAIMELLDQMGLDMANFQLRALRPHLVHIAVDYEREKFSSALQQGQVNLVNTRHWLKDAARRLVDAANQRNPEQVEPQERLKAQAVFEEAMVSLFSMTSALRPDTCPETLYLDMGRLNSCINETQRVTIVAALVMLARNFGHTGDIDELIHKLFVMLADDSTKIDHLAAELAESAKISPERRPIVHAMINKTLKHTDTVYSLLSRRVSSVIRASIQKEEFVSHDVLVSYGLESVHDELKRLSERITRLACHNRQVYAKWYDDIINEELGGVV
ncbi:T-complex protein 11-domain-containing protein [Syncephalastrum racemosum]|uniref:T-complex protein 11-domain-containing protein n=1 Tax=Syncephalastrum racemosum TaxID=13706 RepID=A0A1X2HBH3_SYNRA|nr:T-complex protein 11-domain-containing protein [Syncephalastrum racemosum]